MISFPVSIRELVSRPPSDTVNALALSASSAESMTVPAGAKFVIFSKTADFYAKPNATAAVGVDTTDGSASELNPASWMLDGVSTIGVISAATCIISFAFYS